MLSPQPAVWLMLHIFNVIILTYKLYNRPIIFCIQNNFKAKYFVPKKCFFIYAHFFLVFLRIIFSLWQTVLLRLICFFSYDWTKLLSEMILKLPLFGVCSTVCTTVCRGAGWVWVGCRGRVLGAQQRRVIVRRGRSGKWQLHVHEQQQRDDVSVRGPSVWPELLHHGSRLRRIM